MFKSFGFCTFVPCEHNCGSVKFDIRREAMQLGLEKEMKMQFESKEINYDGWESIPKENRVQPKLTISFDMVCQKCSSRKLYDSMSGHVFNIST